MPTSADNSNSPLYIPIPLSQPYNNHSQVRQTTFLSLSRELRDSIYGFALISSVPLVAWSGMRPANPEVWKHHHFQDELDKAQGHRATTSTIRKLLSNLLQCNSIVAHEAALIFYGKNTFLFSGDWTWETVADWLMTVGSQNRGFITQLELSMGRPSRAWQQPDGERIAVPEALEPPYPRSPFLFAALTQERKGL
ncbi:hypothetical protein B0J14DRAFT_579450 [Halenospora varia]|nr:hypothetical protein B0J14DRAFT_579450 [Halenospora varia]